MTTDVSEFVTLDGVMEAPGHEEHRDGKNAWALRAATEDQQVYKACWTIATLLDGIAAHIEWGTGVGGAINHPTTQED